MSYGDVLGNEPIKSTLIKVINNRKIFHGYLFEGEKGIGKKALAEEFAKAILCEAGTGDSCGNCLECIKALHGNQEKIYYTGGEQSVKDDQIRELQERISKRSFDGKWTVVIIDHADSMTLRAQNRLLKTLEEPPAGVVIILLAANASSLIPTIVSRCVVYRLKPVNIPELTKYLVAKHKVDLEEAQMTAIGSGGLPGKAEELLASHEFREMRTAAVELMGLLFSGKPFYRIREKLHIFSVSRDTGYILLDILQYWVRDIILMEHEEAQRCIINIDKIPELEKMAYYQDSVDFFFTAATIEEARNDLNRNLNTSYVLKKMLLKIQINIGQKKGIE